MIQEKFIKDLQQGVNEIPKSRFPIRVIIFDELELINFVSQGLTLLTASLVWIVKWEEDFLREYCTETKLR